MKTLITGCAGFIGSNLSKKLVEEKDQVIGIDNFNDYYDPKFKEKNIKGFKDSKNFKLYRQDITKSKAIKKIFEKEQPDKVVHLAARAGVRPSLEDPLLYEKVNIRGTLNILEGCRDSSCNQIVFASSSSVYGGREKVPFKESDDVTKPISPYAATKKSGELLCYTYHHLYDIKATCLRFFTVYGPRGRPDMAPYIFTRLISQDEEVKMFGDGSSKRDYTYIDDIVSGISKALKKPFDYQIINLGNSQTVELKYFINLVGKILGKEPKINQLPTQPGDVPITYADISKAKKLLGYDPQTSFEEGMEKFIAWYQKERA